MLALLFLYGQLMLMPFKDLLINRFLIYIIFVLVITPSIDLLTYKDNYEYYIFF